MRYYWARSRLARRVQVKEPELSVCKGRGRERLLEHAAVRDQQHALRTARGRLGGEPRAQRRAARRRILGPRLDARGLPVLPPLA